MGGVLTPSSVRHWSVVVHLREHSLTYWLQTSKSKKEADGVAPADGRNVPLSARPGSTRPPSSRRPPWKGTDVTPQDTWRHNYLDNDDEIEKVNKLSVLFAVNSYRDYFL